ncbi:MAG: acetylornithine deacetylase [Pseudomonadota bacterium]
MPLPDPISMIGELLRIPSVSCFDPALDTSNVPVCERLAQYLNDAGASVHLQPVKGRIGKVNLIAQFGEGPPGLALCGHTDTVPYDDARWDTDPFDPIQRESRLYGLGSSDMKGFLALCASVLDEIAAGSLTRRVVVVGSADEETGMDGARDLLDRGEPIAPMAVIGEPTMLRPIRQHKGIFMERIELEGRSGHSSNPALGHNAIDALHDVLTDLKAWRVELSDMHANAEFDVPAPTVNFGRIEGGDNPNRICARATLDLDVRLTPGMTVRDTRAALRDRVLGAVARHGINAEFKALFNGVDPLSTPADADIVRACEHVTGHGAGNVNFGTEAPFFSALGAQSVVCGPGDIDLAHQPNEYLDLTQIEPTRAMLRSLIHRYCQTPTRP